MTGPDDEYPSQPESAPSRAHAAPKSYGTLLFAAGAVIALAAGAYFLFLAGDKKDESPGIRVVAGQPQLPQQQTRPAQQAQSSAPQNAPAPGDQILTLNMQFTQTLVRSEGRCPSNVQPNGTDFSPRTVTKVMINKTKRTIQVENSDGTKSDIATYDAATGLALITYQGVLDNRTSTVKVTDQTLDGESTFFPYRGRPGGESYVDCKFVLKTTAKVV